MNSSASPSSWAKQRCGDAAVALYRAIPKALQLAHERALAGHEAMGLSSNDIYGHMWQTQHEELIKQVRDIDGVRLIKPKGVRYQLASVGPSNTVLYPWRYGDSLLVDIDQAKMRMSDVRRSLLGLNPASPSRQGTLDQAKMTEAEFRALDEEAAKVLDEMASAGRMTVIAYASNPYSGILRAFWGEATQADGDGLLSWPYREELQLIVPPEEGTGSSGKPVRPVPPPHTRTTGPRFDDAPMKEPELDIRTPLAPPSTDPEGPQPETGSDA